MNKAKNAQERRIHNSELINKHLKILENQFETEMGKIEKQNQKKIKHIKVSLPQLRIDENKSNLVLNLPQIITTNNVMFEKKEKDKPQISN